MLEITQAKVRRWADENRLPILRTAELDYRLCHLMAAIAADAFLAKRLAFKGGTAINKLYLLVSSRLSVDLDYNHLGARDAVQGERQEVLRRLERIVRDQDARVAVDRRNTTWDRYGLVVDFPAVTGGTPIRIKIEISTTDRIPILGRTSHRFRLPDGDEVQVATLVLEELLATKLHAAYARKKGRDAYDLHRARTSIADPVALRKMAVYYFYRRRRTVFDPAKVFHNLTADDAHEWVQRDLEGLLRSDDAFDAKAAIRDVRTAYRGLTRLDAADRTFLAAAKHKLGKLGVKRAGPGVHWEYPLASLFDGVRGISEEARSATWDEIGVHQKPARKPRKA